MINPHYTQLPELPFDGPALKTLALSIPAAGWKRTGGIATIEDPKMKLTKDQLLYEEPIAAIIERLKVKPFHAGFLLTAAGENSRIHIDVRRFAAINIVISGGPNSSSQWYTNFNGNETLAVLNRDVHPFLLNIRIPHAVINQEGEDDRITLTISFQTPYDRLARLHKQGDLIDLS